MIYDQFLLLSFKFKINYIMYLNVFCLFGNRMLESLKYSGQS
jgi:hypothetical protein